MAENSKLDKQWLAQTIAQNPPTALVNPETGQPTGALLTGPVRLSFPNLFKPGKPMDADKEPSYGAALLFPEGVNFQPLVDAVNQCLTENFAEYAATSFQGLKTPFRDQGEKAAKFDGYVPGRYFFSVSTQYKPPIVDHRIVPIVDESKVYPGVWAICTVNPFPFDVTVNKGVSFGLQNVMIIADDEQLGGRGIDPNTAFTGVNVTPQAPVAGQFGMVPGTTMPAGAVPTAPSPAPAAPAMPSVPGMPAQDVSLDDVM